MSDSGIKHIAEAILFASEEELGLKQIKDFIDLSGVSVSLKEIESAIDELNAEYKNEGRGFEIIQIAGGYQFATKREYAEFVGKMKAESLKKKLSQSALETLAIIAYKQPITRTEIEFIRGVNVDYIVNSLLKRDLILIKGRQVSPGSPILYGTTDQFLRILGLNSISDLPKLREINEILKNEKVEGITEADIDLFNSVNYPTTQPIKLKDQEEINFTENKNYLQKELTEDNSDSDNVTEIIPEDRSEEQEKNEESNDGDTIEDK